MSDKFNLGDDPKSKYDTANNVISRLADLTEMMGGIRSSTSNEFTKQYGEGGKSEEQDDKKKD